MKKIVVSILFLASVCAYAQSFKLYEVVNFAEGDEILNGTFLPTTCKSEVVDGILHVLGETYAVLENTSDMEKIVVCKREIIEMVDEAAETYFCWSTCNASNVWMDEKPVNANTKTGVIDFSTHYTAPPTVGSSIVRYTFYDKYNAEDSISVVYEYITPPDVRISTYNADFSLSAHPNPAVDYLTVEMNDLSLQQAVVTVYDAIGREVKTQLMSSNATKIDVTDLEQGIYYLRIVNNNNTIGVRKFVKQ